MNEHLFSARRVACTADLPRHTRTMASPMLASYSRRILAEKMQVSLPDGNESASRLGFLGTEDLRGRYKELFVLKNDFTTTTSALQVGREFGRRRLILLRLLGTFVRGLDWAPHRASYGYHPGGPDDVYGTERANDATKLVSNGYYGLQIGASYGVVDDVAINEPIPFGLNYVNALVKYGGACLLMKNPNSSLFGSEAIGSAMACNITSPTCRGYLPAAPQPAIGAGVSYVVGSAIICGICANTELKDMAALQPRARNLGAAVLGVTASFNAGELNLTRYAMPAAIFASVHIGVRVTPPINSGAIGTQLGVSKRTDVRLVAQREMAAGFDFTGNQAVAALTFATQSTNKARIGVTLSTTTQVSEQIFSLCRKRRQWSASRTPVQQHVWR